MKRMIWIVCAGVMVALALSACGGGADKGGATTAPAAAAKPAAAADDAAKFSGKWMSEAGQLTEYAFEGGKLYVLFGSDKSECTLADGQISYSAGGMNVRMNYRFVDPNTIEYTDVTMPGWSLVQKRQ
jgi:hypothetical protein